MRIKDNEYKVTLRFRMKPNMLPDQLGEMVQKTRSVLESYYLDVHEVYSKLEYHTLIHYVPYIEAEFTTDNGEENTPMCETLKIVHDVITELLKFRQFRTTEIKMEYMD